jgi:hypothetical protein
MSKKKKRVKKGECDSVFWLEDAIMSLVYARLMDKISSWQESRRKEKSLA